MYFTAMYRLRWYRKAFLSYGVSNNGEVAKTVFIHMRLLRAYLALTRLSCSEQNWVGPRTFWSPLVHDFIQTCVHCTICAVVHWRYRTENELYVMSAVKEIDSKVSTVELEQYAACCELTVVQLMMSRVTLALSVWCPCLVCTCHYSCCF